MVGEFECGNFELTIGVYDMHVDYGSMKPAFSSKSIYCPFRVANRDCTPTFDNKTTTKQTFTTVFVIHSRPGYLCNTPWKRWNCTRLYILLINKLTYSGMLVNTCRTLLKCKYISVWASVLILVLILHLHTYMICASSDDCGASRQEVPTLHTRYWDGGYWDRSVALYDTYTCMLAYLKLRIVEIITLLHFIWFLIFHRFHDLQITMAFWSTENRTKYLVLVGLQ